MILSPQGQLIKMNRQSKVIDRTRKLLNQMIQENTIDVFTLLDHIDETGRLDMLIVLSFNGQQWSYKVWYENWVFHVNLYQFRTNLEKQMNDLKQIMLNRG